MSTRRRQLSKEVLNPLHQIFHIAFRTPSDIADIFVRWSAHVDSVDVSVHVGGWRAQVEPNFTFDVYTHQMTPATLNGIRDFLIATVKAIQEKRPLPVKPSPLN